ncbi:MAG TPA: DUF5313 family protein [Pseudonocardiaceae bacterium]|jgi:hypothetical protein|nr:DUF5313 family protein [Pseudonocardiaceae bacterium]
MRPNPAWWLYYQFGGRLPARYRAWVLHDGTCRTWLLRVFVRGLVLVAPAAAVLFAGFLVFGHSLPLALGSIVLGLLVNVRYSLSYSVESVDRRLARHGYPPQYGSTVRREAYEAAHADETARYRAAYRPTDE